MYMVKPCMIIFLETSFPPKSKVCAAIVKTSAGPSSPPLYTEKDWNNESTLENGKNLLRA